MQKNKALIVSVFLSFLAIALSVLAWVSFIYRNIAGTFFGIINKSWFGTMIFYFLIALAAAITGLIIGIKKVKTANRIIAILTIIISVVSILVTIFSWYAVELSIFAQTT